MSENQSVGHNAEHTPIRRVIGSNIGDHGTIINYFRDRRTRVLILAGIFVTIVGLVISTWLLLPKPARAALEVAALSVAKPSKIDADYNPEVVSTHKSMPIDVTNVDITLKNNGTAPAVITGARVEVLYVEQLEDCPGGAGPGILSASYTIKLPTPLPPQPFTVSRDMRFYVEGGKADRLALNIGPQTKRLATTAPVLIVAKIVLLQSDPESTLEVGSVAVLSESDSYTMQPEYWRGADCVNRNLDRVNRAFEIQAERSDELNQLHDELARFQE